jgi:hypothetical protein
MSEFGGAGGSNVGRQVDTQTQNYEGLAAKKAAEAGEKLLEQTSFTAKDVVKHVANGKKAEVGKNLLINMVKKVAERATPILMGKRNEQKTSKLDSDVKLLFGEEESSEDTVSLSKDSQLGQLQSHANKKMQAKNQSIEEFVAEGEGEEGVDGEASLMEAIFEENTALREKLQQGEDLQNEIAEGSEDLLSEIEAESVDLEEKQGEEDSLEEMEEATKKVDDVDGIDDDDVLVRGDQDAKDEEVNAKQGKDDKKIGLRKTRRKQAQTDSVESEEPVGNDDLSKSFEKLQNSQKIALKNRQSELDESLGSIEERGEGDGLEEESVSDDDDELGDDDDTSVDAVKGKKGTKKASKSKGDGSTGQGDGGNDDDSSSALAKKTKPLSRQKAISKYLKAFEAGVRKGNSQTSALNELEQQLVKDGSLTSRQVKDLQLLAKKSVRADLQSKIQDGIIDRQLTKGARIDNLQAGVTLNSLMAKAEGLESLGGKDFGNFKGGLTGTVNDVMQKAGSELRQFALESIKEKFIETHLSDDGDRGEQFGDFLEQMEEITNKSGVAKKWFQKESDKMEDHLGLKALDTEIEDDERGVMVNHQAGMMGQSGAGDEQEPDHDRSSDYDFDDDDEKSILINRLRALYMQQALNPGMRNRLKTDFKIRKLKNGLMRLGVLTDVLNEQVQEEGKEVAKERTLEMLQEAFIERASMYSVESNAFKVVETKIKGIVKNAGSFGFEIKSKSLDKLRDEANVAMFKITKQQLDLLEVRMSDSDMPALVAKYRELTKLLDRLKEESGIEDDYDRHDQLDVTITEEA